MTTFDERERAFENRFAHEQDLQFQAIAQRNRAIGLWAAERLGKSGALADAYAASVVATGIAEAGDAIVAQKIRADLVAGGVTVTERDIAARMSKLLGEAIAAQK